MADARSSESGEAEAKPASTELQPRSREGYLLALSSGLTFGSEIAVRQAGAQLWLDFFDGNTVAFAVSRGRLMPIIHLISFVVTPMMGGLSDTFGRRPLMFFAQAVQLLAFGGILLFDESFALYMMEFLSIVSQRGQSISNRAAFGDLFGHDKERYTQFIAVKELMTPAFKMTVPLVAGLMARRSLRLPFYLSVVLGSLNGLFLLAIPEPLSPAKRKPFSLGRSLNPFGCVQLFRRGQKMAYYSTISVMGVFSESCAGINSGIAEQLCELHRVEVLGWDTFQRSRWESTNSLFRTFGFVFTTGFLGLPKLIGIMRSLDVGLGLYIVQALWLAFARSAWQFYAVLPLYLIKLLRDSVDKTNLQHAGMEAGFGNGEIAALTNNLFTIVQALGPMPWAWVYSIGVSRGQPGMFYLLVAGLSALRLGLLHKVHNMG